MNKLKVCDHGVVSPHICDECVAVFSASFHLGAEGVVTFDTESGNSARPGHDPVNSPSHYTSGGIETIDYLAAKLSPDEFSGYCRGNALKYLSRLGKKGDYAEDLGKAIWYLNCLSDYLAPF